MTKAHIYARLDQLEMSLNGDQTDDSTRADVLDEIAELERQLSANPDDAPDLATGKALAG